MTAPFPNNEAKRIAALERLRILDTAPEQVFDDFAFLASTICQTPMAMLTFVDGDRQWIKAREGVSLSHTPREHAFCAHTILGRDLMVVENAREDRRFSNNPLVTGNPNIVFYAGAPLIDGEGHGLGAICVLDSYARSLNATQSKALKALARQVMAQLELRHVSHELADALSDIKVLRGLLPICAHCKEIRNDAGLWESIESYVSAHSDAGFTHGICPKCMEKHFPDAYAQLKAEGRM